MPALVGVIVELPELLNRFQAIFMLAAPSANPVILIAG